MAKKAVKSKLLDLFKETVKPNNWEIYLPFEDSHEYLLLRPICSKCKKSWLVDRKECFYCKTKYFRVKTCPTCSTIYPENVPRCSKDKSTNVKMCLNCRKIDSERNVVFVPITFCWFCGNRENEFEWKLVTI